MNVNVLALQGTFDLGLSALLDTLGTANELASTMNIPTTAIKVSLVGVQRRVRTAQGLSVSVVAPRATPRPDAVLLPALGEKMPASLAQRLSHRDVGEAGGLLKEWAQGGAWIGAACTSTFVLAESALLDGHGARRRGGSPRSFGNATCMSLWMNLACWCRRVLSSPLEQR
jgi:transcriptional regulator GlxA family with amidase domain